MKFVNILFWLLLITLNSCNSNDNDALNKNNMQQQEKGRQKRDLDKQGLQEEEKITLTAEEEKLFNSLQTAFQYTIEKLSNQIQGCNNGNKSKCTDFFNWLSKDIQKQKELANAFKKVYDFLDKKRQEKANNKDFDTYIKGGIDCQANNANGNNCNDGKHGNINDTNEIEQYFRGVANDIFNKNDPDEIYKCFKEELLDENNHYASLSSWN
ncbi:Mlp family lipoprotein [Borreliella bavariensis]|uniref:Mlp family lipoprotein n=1 Tax=Borreliella bavariensis TaxID=664662 RepID=UPI001C0303BB|nr:Mlp family lipoprotein [Borreliella bavariensis]